MDAFVRYYDPVAGRFLSEDPVITDANTGSSFNRYAYANNNPYRYIDPDGREPGDKDDRAAIKEAQNIRNLPPTPPPSVTTASTKITIPDPNAAPVPGGPWTESKDPKPGKFDGPKQPPGCGGRMLCQYVPPESQGGTPGAKEGYWKTQAPGTKGWQRYDLKGEPITVNQAHGPGAGKPASKGVGLMVFVGMFLELSEAIKTLPPKE